MRKQVVLLFCLLNHCALSQWEVVYQNNYQDVIHGISFVNDSTGFMLRSGDFDIEGGYVFYSTIYKTTDYAASWDTAYHYQTQCPCPPDSLIVFNDIFFINEQTGWVCSENTDKILKTTNGGESWQTIDTQLSETVEEPQGQLDFGAIRFYDENYGVLQTKFSGIHGMESFDSGESWTINDYFNGNDCYLFDECNSIVNHPGTIKKKFSCEWYSMEFPTSDEVPERNGRAIHAWNFDNYLLGAIGVLGFNNFSSILKTTDGGESYHIIDFPFGVGVIDFEFVNDSTGYASLNAGSSLQQCVYKTTDYGVHWHAQETALFDSGEYQYFKDIDCPSENVCYGFNGQFINRTFNGGGELGQVWTMVEEPRENNETSIQLFPNPVSAFLKIQCPSEISQINITNLFGRAVYSVCVGTSQIQLNLEQLSSGCYMLTITLANGNTITRKFLKE